MARLGVLFFLVFGVFSFAHMQGIPTLQPTLCPFGVLRTQQIDCYWLNVPENRADPASPTISLAVAVIRAQSANPQPDPILYLSGGPGSSALQNRDLFFNLVFGADRDIILYDQRGTGFSLPSLSCDQFGFEMDDEDDSEALTLACRDALLDLGIDLSAYNSAASAADIQDLRVALGYAQINLYGISYGSRLALTVLRDDPRGIRSAIIDGVYPPHVDAWNQIALNADRAFEAVFAACDADRACAAAYPDLREAFYELVDLLNDQPLELEDSDYTGDDLVSSLFEALYDASVVGFIPALIYDTLNDDFDLLEDLIGGVLGPDSDEEGAPDAEEYGELFNEYFDILSFYLGYDSVDEFLLDFAEWDEDETVDAFEFFFDEADEEDLAYLFALFLGTDDLDEFYTVIEMLTEDEFDVLLAEFMYLLTDGVLGFTAPEDSDGMYNSVECYEEVPFNDLDEAIRLSVGVPLQVAEPMLISFEEMLLACAVWLDAATPDPVETALVISDVPTLIISGEFDPITPPSFGFAAAEGLPNSQHIVFPTLSHGSGIVEGCPQSLMAQFLANPGAPLSLDCLAGMEPIRFIIR